MDLSRPSPPLTPRRSPGTSARVRYFARLTAGRIILWCYLLWYIFFAVRYFDPSRGLWLTSLGVSGIVGIALVISTRSSGSGRLGFWGTARLFMMPFCVSSFSALVKSRGFLLMFSPRLSEDYLALGLCAAFCAFVAGVRLSRR
jgi:hypothetical protein